MANTTDNDSTPKKPKEKDKPELPHCGVIMPISGTPEYTAGHWADMLQLIQEAAKDAQFTCEIVSATGRDDIIHSSIVNNIYQNEIVVCDVSSRNPNVMLELGLRLASKLPLVVIFDGEGSYPFDIGTIRYLPYRRDMRYYDTNKFKKDLTSKILEVYNTHKEGKYKSFLSHFKNVDFNLDEISTETQSLKQFMESIDGRLSAMEGNKLREVSYYNKDSKRIHYERSSELSEGYAGALVESFIEGYLENKGLAKYSHDLFPSYRDTIINELLSADIPSLNPLSRKWLTTYVNNYIDRRLSTNG